MEVRVGVLACQGSFKEHVSCLRRLAQVPPAQLSLREGHHHDFRIVVDEIRSGSDLHDDHLGLVIPGGESTTLNMFLQKDHFLDRIRQWRDTKPTKTIWGTCAGMILLSNSVVHQEAMDQQLGGVDITTDRNFYGRQLQSFEQEVTLLDPDLANDSAGVFRGIFIRAPGVVSVDHGDKVHVLAILGHDGGAKKGTDQAVVAAKQGNLIVTAFHPELTEDLRFHRFFLKVILDSL